MRRAVKLQDRSLPAAQRSEVRKPSKAISLQTLRADTLAHASETFGGKQKADHWLARPNSLFGGKTPREVLLTDPQSIEAELVRIDHGVYV